MHRKSSARKEGHLSDWLALGGLTSEFSWEPVVIHPLPIEIDYHLQKFDYEIAQFHDVILYTL
jgi:hypothetical protein